MIFKKNYPLTTKARKIWVLVISVLMPLIVILIIANLAFSRGFAQRAEKEQQTKSDVQETATNQDTQWYQASSVPPLTPQQKAEFQAILLGKNMNKNNFLNDQNTGNAENNEESETQKAMGAPISSNQITVNNPNNDVNNEDNNKKDEIDEKNKNKFNAGNDDYLGSVLHNPVSPYELQAGSVIPAVLITGVNSDLAGQMIAQVTENIYDSISGNNLLVPQGTKVIGVYDSKIAYGQERVLVAWKRLIFPNGQSLDLNGMEGADLSGYAGFQDTVDNHYSKIFGSVILMSMLSSGAQLSQSNDNQNNQNNSNNVNSNQSVNQIVAQSLGTNIANTGNSILQKDLNIQPTLKIRAGYQFNIMVTKDMVLSHSIPRF